MSIVEFFKKKKVLGQRSHFGVYPANLVCTHLHNDSFLYNNVNHQVSSECVFFNRQQNTFTH